MFSALPHVYLSRLTPRVANPNLCEVCKRHRFGSRDQVAYDQRLKQTARPSPIVGSAELLFCLGPAARPPSRTWIPGTHTLLLTKMSYERQGLASATQKPPRRLRRRPDSPFESIQHYLLRFFTAYNFRLRTTPPGRCSRTRRDGSAVGIHLTTPPNSSSCFERPSHRSSPPSPGEHMSAICITRSERHAGSRYASCFGESQVAPWS